MNNEARTLSTDMTVSPSGEIDVATSERFRLSIEQTLDHPDAELLDRLIIDLGAVTFMDSSGLKCLALANHRMLQRGGRVEARNVHPQVRRIIEIVGMDKVIDLVDAAPEAPSPPSARAASDLRLA